MIRACLVLALVLAAGCGGPVAGLYPPRTGEAVTAVWVVAHGWHAGIAVRARDVPATLWPERRDFPRAEYLEVGWGDRAYWQAADPGLALALWALVLPTPSTVRVIAVDEPLAAAFAGAEIVELRLSRAGFERLLRFVDDTFARTGAGAAAALGPASWPHSRFYPAHGSYHALRTSNTWTARALREAGVPITPAFALSPRAEAKAATKQTDDGLPVHSFHTLMADLATLTKNRVQPKTPGSPAFEMLATPTSEQQRAFELLGVSPRL